MARIVDRQPMPVILKMSYEALMTDDNSTSDGAPSSHHWAWIILACVILATLSAILLKLVSPPTKNADLLRRLNYFGYAGASQTSADHWIVDLDGSGPPQDLVIDIGKLGKVESANLCHNLQVGDEAIEKMLNLSQGVECLYVAKTSVRGDCLQTAARVDAIKRLHIGGYTKPIPNDWLGRLIRVEELQITNADITLNDANQLLGLHSLRECVLIDCRLDPEATKLLQRRPFKMVESN